MNLTRPQKLKFVFAATVLAAAGIEGTVLAQRHQVPAGRDAFLNYQVDSTDELVAVLKKNQALRQRYARHFGIPEDRVIAFVKEALVPYRVPQNCTVTDHGVTSSGRIYPVKVTLKKGTKVWATRSGLPILKWACANPLAKTMPGTVMASRPHSTRTPLGAPPVEFASATPLPILAPLPEGLAYSPEVATPDTVAVDTSALALPPALTGIGTASVPAIASASLPSGGGKGGPGIGAFVIPAIVAVAVGSNGGGGNNSSTAPTDNTIISPTNGGSTTNGGTIPGGTTNGGTIPGGGNGSTTNGGIIPGGNNGGDTNGGDTNGGSNGGTTNGGSSNGGDTNGGILPGGGNGGTTNGGDTNGGATNGGIVPPGDNNGGGGNGGGGNPTVPEPGTLVLFTVAGLPAFAAARRRFAKK